MARNGGTNGQLTLGKAEVQKLVERMLMFSGTRSTCVSRLTRSYGVTAQS